MSDPIDRRMFLGVLGGVSFQAMVARAGFALPLIQTCGRWDPEEATRSGLTAAEGGAVSALAAIGAHGHTRLVLRHLDEPVFQEAHRQMASMGVRAYVRHIKTADEGAWWPSEVGVVDPRMRGRDVAGQIIEGAQQAGIGLIVYYRHMEDEWAAEQNPSWVCRDWQGSRVESPRRGLELCFNSPYRGFVQTRLSELVRRGARAFYFDSHHMPQRGCWCEWCTEGFRRETGRAMPGRPDPRDPDYQALVEFNNRTVEATFAEWKRALRAIHPEVLLIVSAGTWPQFRDPHLNGRLFRIADLVKTEFSLPIREARRSLYAPDRTLSSSIPDDVRMAVGLAMCRDAADGRPAHVWIPGMTSESEARFATAGVLAHGGIANIDFDQVPDPMFEPVFEFANHASELLGAAKPLSWAGIHYSEALLNERYYAFGDGAAEKAIYPVIGAYETFLRARLPVRIVTDAQLEDGAVDPFEVLVLVRDEALMSPAMRQTIQGLRATGTEVVVLPEEWGWYGGGDRHRQAGRALRERVEDLPITPPYRVEGGPEALHVEGYRGQDGRLIVALVNHFSWVEAHARRDEPSRTPAPPPVEGVSLAVDGLAEGARVREWMSGETLQVSDGSIVVPSFAELALIEVVS